MKIITVLTPSPEDPDMWRRSMSVPPCLLLVGLLCRSSCMFSRRSEYAWPPKHVIRTIVKAWEGWHFVRDAALGNYLIRAPSPTRITGRLS